MSVVYVSRCLVVPAAYAPLARALCSGLAEGGAGDGMLGTALSPTGSAPATHFISQGMVEEGLAYLLPFTTFTKDAVTGKDIVTTSPGQPEMVVTLAKGSVTLTQVTSLLNAIDVTEQAPFVALSRLGLKLIQAPVQGATI